MAAKALAPKNGELARLYKVLDERRQSLHLTWHQVIDGINSLFGRSLARPLAHSTVTALRTAALAEADGVLQMLRWLDLPPESLEESSMAGAKLPAAGDAQILRLDTRSLHAALEAKRLQRGLSWARLADEIGGVGPSTLTRLAAGGRTAFPTVLRLTSWLGQPVASFVRPSPR